MLPFLIRRLLVIIPVLAVVASLVFFAFALVPGNPAEVYAGTEGRISQVKKLEQEWGLDRPLGERYVKFMKDLLKGDLGLSFHTGEPVVKDIVPKYLATLELATFAFSGALALGVLFGVLAASRQGAFLDRFLSVFVVLGISMPQFWLALMLMFFFGVRLGWLPPAGKGGLASYILPAMSMGVFAMAFVTRMTRSCVLEVIPQDFVRTARAKGLAERVVMYKHVLRNALLPIVTVAGIRLGYMLGQSVVTETVFAWPGMAVYFIRAIHMRDYPAVRAAVIVYALSFMLINLAVDILYAVIDPRTRRS